MDDSTFIVTRSVELRKIIRYCGSNSRSTVEQALGLAGRLVYGLPGNHQTVQDVVTLLTLTFEQREFDIHSVMTKGLLRLAADLQLLHEGDAVNIGAVLVDAAQLLWLDAALPRHACRVTAAETLIRNMRGRLHKPIVLQAVKAWLDTHQLGSLHDFDIWWTTAIERTQDA